MTNPSSIDDWSTRYDVYQTLLQNNLGANASSVKLMATEFNSVYTNPGKQSTSLVNGLFVANSIGSLLNSGYVGGYIWDLRNGWDSSSDQNSSESLYGWRMGGDYGILGDPGQSLAPSTGAYIAYPNYYAEQLASQLVQAGGQVVSAGGNYSELNSYAVLESNGHLRLMVVNSNPAAALTEQFNLQGFQASGQAQLWQYGVAQDTAQSQSSSGASSLANFTTTLALSGAGFSYSFPAYSMTVIDLTPAASVINGSGTIALKRDADLQHIDWTLGASSGQVLITAAAGLTINGNDTINLDYTNGTPLPNALHLNGTFTINNLASALAGANPLAGTNLEIGRSTVYINYAGGTDPIAAIQTYLRNGYNAGAWTGTPTATIGVITSTAAATNASKATAIGYVDSADGLVAGQPANTIELMYTLYGDTGLAGTVSFTDFMRMTQHYTSTNAQWDMGDFNYDGTVDVSDFNLLKPVYGQTLASQPAPVAPTVTVAPAPTPSDPPKKKPGKSKLAAVVTQAVQQPQVVTVTASRKHRGK